MVALLLLGAGFTRNWKGLLASEVRTDIAMRLESHPSLRELLNRHENFEDALEIVQAEYVRASNVLLAAERLRQLQAAIVATFDEMNSGLSSRAFEFTNRRECSVVSYLTSFDAIFTLNQDLLLERHYLSPRQVVLLASGARLDGVELPGMEQISASSGYGDDQPLRVRWRPLAPPYELSPRVQPYIKLHGSTNWYSSSGEQLLVMGGSKPETIKRHPILDWYAKEFLRRLSEPGARLTVIGYSFRDAHINSALLKAWNESHFPMMIVHPAGRQVLKVLNPTHDKPIGMPGPFDAITAYNSTRSLDATFGDGDIGEIEKLNRFNRGPIA